MSYVETAMLGMEMVMSPDQTSLSRKAPSTRTDVSLFRTIVRLAYQSCVPSELASAIEKPRVGSMAVSCVVYAPTLEGQFI